MRGPVFAAIAAVLAFSAPAARAQVPVTSAAAGATSPTEWTAQPWGEMGVACLATAPYPDDTRTTGYQSRAGVIPREGHYDDNSVAFVIPRGFRASATPDLILHFHGHGNNCRKVVPQFRLGEMLEASGRNAILIAPQGPKDAPDSGCGKLEKPGGFAAFAAECMEVLAKEGRLPRGARPGRIILGGHSGGYKVIGQILDHGGLADAVREVWLWDAAYGQLDEIAAAFVPPSKRVLRSIFTDHLTTENIHIMSRLCLKGAMVGVFEDDLLSTAGMAAAQLAEGKFHSIHAKPGKDEIAGLLRDHPLLFLHTTLTHNGVIMDRRYFEIWARESANLRAR